MLIILPTHADILLPKTLIVNKSKEVRWLSGRSIPETGTTNLKFTKKNQIKSSLYSPYYAEACNELRGPSPRLSAWATQLRRNVATVAGRWRHCVRFDRPGN